MTFSTSAGQMIHGGFRFLGKIFRKYLADFLFVPPIMVGVCYFLYGDYVFESAWSFIRTVFPWFLSAVLVAAADNWFMYTIAARFPDAADWRLRVTISVPCYLMTNIGIGLLTYYTVSRLNYEHLVFSWNHVWALTLFAVMSTGLGVSIHESFLYFKKWKAAIVESESLEKLHLESQFESLQNQLNPHFLFNCFNSLSSLIGEDPPRAEKFVDELSNVYRYLLRNNENELSTVAEELRFIRSYFHLLKTRYEEGIAWDIQVSAVFQDMKLPPLALQILVENAVKHNQTRPSQPLHIEISSSPGGLLVRNNIQRRPTLAPSNKVGLENLRKRYELLGQTGFSIEEDGRLFNVFLPVL